MGTFRKAHEALPVMHLSKQDVDGAGIRPAVLVYMWSAGCAELCCQFVAACIVMHAMQDIILAYTARCARQQASAHVSHRKRRKSAPLGDHNDKSLLMEAATWSFHHTFSCTPQQFFTQGTCRTAS
jgi:hypothetical protein